MNSLLTHGEGELHASAVLVLRIPTQITTHFRSQTLGYTEVELRWLTHLIGILEPLEEDIPTIFWDTTSRILHEKHY